MRKIAEGIGYEEATNLTQSMRQISVPNLLACANKSSISSGPE
jgi:hypothetical protein